MTIVSNVNSVTLNRSTYTNNKNIKTVDLANVPFVNNEMGYGKIQSYGAFYNCINLISVSNINSNITSMPSTFAWCNNLASVSQLPNNLTNMFQTFYRCTNLVNAPVIPNSVTDMTSTFSNCHALVNAPVIPNSVTDMTSTFSTCNSLVNAPVIPNSVTNMFYSFSSCYNLVNAPVIPNSVTDMTSTFYNCTKLINAPEIPNSVTTMDSTFHSCSNLVNAPAIPNSVASMTQTFMGCSNLSHAPEIPNSVTVMFQTFQNCYSLVNGPDMNNATNVTNMRETFQNCSGLVTAPSIPQNVAGLLKTFKNCSSLTGDIFIHPENISTISGCFDNTSLDKNVYIPFYYQESFTRNLYGWDCSGWDSSTEELLEFPLYTDYDYTSETRNISDIIIYYSNGIVDTRWFGSWEEKYGESGMKLSIMKDMGKWLEQVGEGYRNSSLDTSVIINQGENTVTYSQFIVSGYGTDPNNRVNGVCLFDLDFYGWNYDTLKGGTKLLYNYSGNKADVVVPSTNTLLNDKYDDKGNVDYTNMPFYGNYNINSVDLRNVPWQNNSMEGAFQGCESLTSVTNINEKVNNIGFGAFQGCTNLVNAPIMPNGVYRLDEAFSGCWNLSNVPSLPNSVDSLMRTFFRCYNLVNAPSIPNSVTDMDYTFAYCNNLSNVPSISQNVDDMSGSFLSCTNLTTVPNIPNSVTCMTETFMGCSNLTGNIYIESEDVDDASYCFAYTTLDKNVYIPFNSAGTPDEYLYAWTNKASAHFYTNEDVYNICNGMVSSYTFDIFDNSGVYLGEGNYNPSDQKFRKSFDDNGVINYDSANNITIPGKPAGELTATYNAFINAGYGTDPNNRVNGVCLFNIYSL